jgi:hypothetical protein
MIQPDPTSWHITFAKLRPLWNTQSSNRIETY